MASRPTLVFTSDGTQHAAWESGGQIYYTAQATGQGWSSPRRVAAGISPVMVLDDFGRLHMLFANRFMGDYEIYHLPFKNGVWDLPNNISHTSSASVAPAVAAGKDGTLYAAWMDYSPGYFTIYLATWNGEYWRNEPVPNARGQAPALAVAGDDTLFLAWQERVPEADGQEGAFDIFLSERKGTSWTLPANISDRPAVESIGAHLATTPDGFVHLTWVDGYQEVRYCFGQGLYWPYPVNVARAASSASGAKILVEEGVWLHIAWDEGDMVRATSAAPTTSTWPKPVVISAPTGFLSDVTLTLGTGNGISVGWIQTDQPQDVGIYESWRISELSGRVWFPMILR